MQTGRRTFIKTVAAGSAAAKARLRGAPGAAGLGEYPRVFTGPHLRMIAFPLGGIGTGTISLGGRGQFRDWEIFNKPDKGKQPKYGFASIWARREGETPVARVLEAQLTPPYEGSSGLGSDNVPGLPRLASARFTGEYPLARIAFEDESLPVEVELEAFTPFIPLDADASGLPVAVLHYRVRNRSAKPAVVGIAFSLDNPVGEEGRACQFQHEAGADGLHFTNPFQGANHPLAGSFAVAALTGGAQVSYLRGWRGGTNWPVGPLHFWDQFSATGVLGPEAERRNTVGSLALKRDIAAGGSATFTFLLTWRFPNRTPKRSGWTSQDGEENTVIGNHYCSRFDSAWSVVAHVAPRLAAYEARTRSFVDAMRRTTLPAPVRDGAMSNLSTLVTQTSFRTFDGKFHGFEGCNNSTGCCFGSCTHVWNYETATAYLFPSLARSLRETSFLSGTDGQGHMDFREILPAGKKRFGTAAADGQMGQIMHLYLDWRLSGDIGWLRTMWPAAKRALEYAWIEGGWDANRDGVMEGVQHNTYDVEFIGPNPLCGVWYLGALRAGREMAQAVGDHDAASEYGRLFDNGSKWIDANLFNGEYYIQKVQGVPRDRVAKGLMAGMGSEDTLHPDFQVGEGCLIDQLLGQYFAHLSGLGLLLDQGNIRKALQSIYRYNYKRRMADHESVERTYALNDEAALIICDYGKAKRPEIPFPYFAEVMTGFEYAAAVLMMHHGMVAEGVECIGNIRRRYDGERRSPWNEAECGHHYARAMASWSAIPALSGWNYNGIDGALEVKPRPKGARFESFWSTASGWGTFAQAVGARNSLALKVTEGSLALHSLEPAWAGAKRVALEGKPVPFTADGNRIVFAEGVNVAAGATLTVSG